MKGNEVYGSYKDGEILEQLIDYQLIKHDPVP
jgi:hypothetical protein